MFSATFLSVRERLGESLDRRAFGLIFTIVIHVLGLILLLTMTPQMLKPKKKPEPVLINLQPQKTPQFATKPKPKAVAGGAAPKSDAPQMTPPKSKPEPIEPSPLDMIVMNKKDFAASDIASIPSHRSNGGPGAGAGNSAGNAYGPGEGPNGEQLYNAEWYREPTYAQMAFYMPKGRNPIGWGMIICRTAPQYHVEDCRQLGESPAGSGISRAMREAAWQFLVRPPRIGGKPMIGAWVRIRYEITQAPDRNAIDRPDIPPDAR